MKLAIDKNVPIPAYQQVVDGIAEAIARGDLGGGTRLPSVRNLAVDLGLNVNTVARAYRDLERAGVIATRPGMGTFVAPRTARGGQAFGSAGRQVLRPIPATGGPADGLALTLKSPASWRSMLAAAHAVAVAEGVAVEEFLAGAADAARTAEDAMTLLVAAPTAGEAADIVRALPSDLATLAVGVDAASLAERAGAGASAVLTTFPFLARVRAALAGVREEAPIVPVETEYTEVTLKRLSALPPGGRIALVTAEKANWDHEANDVMKVIGRGRWLKMVLLEAGERGLGERLENIDVVLHVPRAREALEAHGAGRTFIELVRQVTARTHERLAQVLQPRT